MNDGCRKARRFSPRKRTRGANSNGAQPKNPFEFAFVDIAHQAEITIERAFGRRRGGERSAQLARLFGSFALERVLEATGAKTLGEQRLRFREARRSRQILWQIEALLDRRAAKPKAIGIAQLADYDRLCADFSQIFKRGRAHRAAQNNGIEAALRRDFPELLTNLSLEDALVLSPAAAARHVLAARFHVSEEYVRKRIVALNQMSRRARGSAESGI